MAVKRTSSSNISSAISEIDRKVKTLESSTTGIATTSSAVSTAETPDDEGAQSGVNALASNAPYTYKKVVGAYIYGPKVTGNTSRAELYFEEDPGIAQAEYVRVQGIHGNTADEIDISGTFKVYAIDEDPWDDDVRATQPWRDEPGAGVTNTVWYNPVVVPPSDSPVDQGLQLITSRLIDSVSASGTTVTVNLNSNHRFEVDDVLYFDLPSSLLDGYTDNLFKVSNVVDNNTIQYELETSLSSPISLNSGDLGTVYVYPVAQKYVEEGTSWTDTSVEPNRVYVWKDYRWYDITEGVDVSAEKDGIAPSPVTNLTSSVDLSQGTNGIIIPTIELSWTAPTTRSDGSSLTNYLDGYEVWYKTSGAATWTKEDAGTETSVTLADPNFRQNVNYSIRVYAVDIFAQYSAPAETTVTTSTYSETLLAPSAPTVTSKLGTVKVYWDGTDTSGSLPVPGVIYVEYHYSTTSGFTPSSSTLYQTQPITSGSNYAIFENLDYSTTYYFKLILVRSDGFNLESSDPSTEVSGTVTPLVNTDVIGQILDGAKIIPGSIVASDSIFANSITANTIAANAITAGKIEANAITADKIDAGALTAFLVQGDTIRTANSGARVELTNAGIYAYGSGGGGPVFAFNTSTETLTVGGYATSNDLTTGLNGKVSGTLVGGAWSTSITGSSITTGTITGITIQTAASGQRIVLNSTTMEIFDGSGYVGTIFGGTSLGRRGILISSATGYVVTPNVLLAGQVQASFASFGEAVAGTKLTVDSIKRQSNGQLTFTTTAGTTIAYFDTSATGSSGVSLWVIGRVSGATSYITRSSRRFKTNIQSYSDSLDSILNLNVVTYQVDQSAFTSIAEEDSEPPLGPVEVGLIAEDVVDAGLESIVAFNSEDPSLVEGIDYGRIGVLLIPVVKKLREELNDLKMRVDAL